MISWNDYLKSNIIDFRRRFKELSEDTRVEIKKNQKLFQESLIEPCQIIVVDFDEPYSKCFGIMHSKSSSDMEIISLENAKFESILSNGKFKTRLQKLLSEKEIEHFLSETQRMGRDSVTDKDVWISRAQQLEFLNGYMFTFKRDPRLKGKNELSSTILGYIHWDLKQLFRQEQIKKIVDTVDYLKRDAQAIPVNVELRNKIIENTQRLDSQIKQLHDKVEGEIDAVRKLIGSSESIQD